MVHLKVLRFSDICSWLSTPTAKIDGRVCAPLGHGLIEHCNKLLQRLHGADVGV